VFFELNEENKIGYKELTNADLGKSNSSGQTHIGLFQDTLTFLPDSIEKPNAMVIYNETLEYLTAYFDRIETPRKTYRSPKIRTGGVNAVSVVSFIRDRAREFDNETKWYLFWFGLKSTQLVFFLFNSNSTEFEKITEMGVNLKKDKAKGRLKPSDTTFAPVIKYLEQIVNNSGQEIIQELEVAVQTNEMVSHKYKSTYNPYDVKKAKELFKQTGRDGEKLIDKYFADLLSQGRIKYYEWKNKETESYLPYDFFVQKLDDEVYYLDVKTTKYSFEQKMVFSSQEIKFVDNCKNKYYIYRVYTNHDKKYLKICDNAKDLFSPIHNKTTDFQGVLDEMAKIESIKMAILPLQKNLVFGEEIAL